MKGAGGDSRCIRATCSTAPVRQGCCWSARSMLQRMTAPSALPDARTAGATSRTPDSDVDHLTQFTLPAWPISVAVVSDACQAQLCEPEGSALATACAASLPTASACPVRAYLIVIEHHLVVSAVR